MKLIIIIMLAVAMTVIFICGYYVGIIKEKYGRNWLLAVPIFVAVLMFNIILALNELSQSGRWQ